MKAFLTGATVLIFTLNCFAQEVTVVNTFDSDSAPKNKRSQTVGPTDTIILKVDGSAAYYQKTVKVDSNIMESMIYARAIQFMASKNFQQNYGFQQEGKLICTTIQDLNLNNVYIGDEEDPVDPYTVQFSITLDIKNRRYRYTISNVVFFRPTDNGNRRLTLYDMYVKATNTSSKHVAKDAKKLITSFENYIAALTAELYASIEQTSAIYAKKW